MATKTEKYSLFGIENLFALFEQEVLPGPSEGPAATPPPEPSVGTLRSLEKRLPFDLSDPLAFLEKDRPPTGDPNPNPSLHPSIFEDGTLEQRNFPNLEHGEMTTVNGIVLHQTASSTAEDTLKTYPSQSTGAHFLIDRDGQIYQTAELDQIAWHVGKIRPRDKEVNTCSEKEYAKSGLQVKNPSASHREEAAKAYPDRFPTNNDSIGIEVVGKYDEKTESFETPTEGQTQSLQRLMDGLKKRYGLTDDDVYRHGSISYKKVAEGCGFGYD